MGKAGVERVGRLFLWRVGEGQRFVDVARTVLADGEVAGFGHA